MHYNMLNKSEIKITHIHLDETNLHQIADCVAEIYGVEREKVLVIDVRNEEVALDILDNNVDPHKFMSKERILLKNLSRIPGVTIYEDSRVTSDGMLGWIAFGDVQPEELDASMQRAEEMTNGVIEQIRKRVIVFPSGTEIERKEIEDTNTPMLVNALLNAGYITESGPVLKDDLRDITQHLQWAVEKGYGTVITTGGVGAEDKDHSVEAILTLDPSAAAPYVAKFEKGHGRHQKDGIRIGVGELEGVTFVALPGPNDEVSLCMPILINGMKQRKEKHVLAEDLANVLRNRSV